MYLVINHTTQYSAYKLLIQYTLCILCAWMLGVLLFYLVQKKANHNKDEKSNLCVRDCITPEYCSTMKLYCVPSLHTAVYPSMSTLLRKKLNIKNRL